MIALALLLACRPPATAVERGPEVRFRTAESPPTPLAEAAVTAVPGATWDKGLAQAATLLAAAARDPSARITPSAIAQALSVAGYPGHARFARELNGGALPANLLDQLAAAALERDQPVDVALTRRNFSDGTTLWIGGIAHRPALLDPLPRDPDLDQPLPVRVELLQPTAPLTLYVALPGGPVRSQPLNPDYALWVDDLHVPGEYRMEVVAADDQGSQVLLLWSHLVETPPVEPGTLPPGDTTPPDPMAGTEALYDAVDRLRADSGLPRLRRFATFEGIAREHAAYMAVSGRVDHRIPGVTEGVPAAAAARYHPRVDIEEAVAAAPSWSEALDLVLLSPGHRRVLLCEDCTHVSIGAALEPTTDRVPRIFVAFELLRFPNGEPGLVPDLDR